MGSGLLPGADEAFLVAVDLQPGLLKAYPPERSEGVVAGAAFALACARALGIPSLLLALEPDKLGPVHPAVLAAAGAEEREVIAKVAYDATEEEGFRGRVAALGRPAAVVLGVEAHVCVLQTATGLLAAGHRVHYLADAVASRDPVDEEVGRRLLERAGVLPLTAETLLYSCLGSGRHPRFGHLLPLLKDRVRRSLGSPPARV